MCIRDRGEPRQVNEVKLAVESGMEVLIREEGEAAAERTETCLLYTSPSPRDRTRYRMQSSA